MNLELRKKIINQVNNLLGLEEDFNASIGGEKLSLILAQVIVNQLNTEEQIEKPDKSNLNIFEEENKNLIEYIDETYPDLMFSVNLNLNETLNKNTLINLPDFIKKQQENLNKIEELKLQQQQNVSTNNTNINNNANSSNVNNNQNSNTNTFNPNQNNNNNNGQFFNGNGMPNNQFGMPQNPILDPRFYPYKTKPKMMPILKKLAFGIFAIISLISAIMLFYISRHFGLTVYAKKDSSGVYYLSFKAQPGYTPNTFGFPFLGGSLITPLIFIMLTIFLGITVFGKKNIKKEKYHIGYMVSILCLIFTAFMLYYFVIYAVPSLFEKTLKAYYSGTGFHWDDTKNQLDSHINSLVFSPIGQSVTYLSIVELVLIFIEIFIFIMIFIYNPRIDQQKIQRAQYEYQKQIEAKFKGEEYHIDQSLFDDEEENEKKE